MKAPNASLPGAEPRPGHLRVRKPIDHATFLRTIGARSIDRGARDMSPQSTTGGDDPSLTQTRGRAADVAVRPSSSLFRALGGRADPIEMRVVGALVSWPIEFADEVPADVDYARVLKLE